MQIDALTQLSPAHVEYQEDIHEVRHQTSDGYHRNEEARSQKAKIKKNSEPRDRVEASTVLELPPTKPTGVLKRSP